MSPFSRKYHLSSKRLKIELPYDPAIPLLGIYPKKTKMLIQKHISIYIPMFISALFSTAKIWKQPKCPSTDEWIKKMWYTHMHMHTHTGILLSHKEGWNLAICDNMGGPREYYAKWNKSKKERKIPYDFTYMWNLKNKTNEKTTKQSCRYREQTGGCQRGGGWGVERNMWGRLRGTNFQLQDKWVTGMKCTAWGTESITL